MFKIFAIAQKKENISCMRKKKKKCGFLRKKIPPSYFVSDFFFLRLKPNFSFLDFRMLSVSQKYSIEQKMTILETAYEQKKIFFCGSLMNVLN